MHVVRNECTIWCLNIIFNIDLYGNLQSLLLFNRYIYIYQIIVLLQLYNFTIMQQILIYIGYIMYLFSLYFK